jgi:hypothetical protein
MSKTFNTPIDIWLNMELLKLFEWVSVADQMLQEENEKRNVQKIGPGL